MKLVQIAGCYVNPEKVCSLEPWKRLEGEEDAAEPIGTIINLDHGAIYINTLTPLRVAEILLKGCAGSIAAKEPS